jgi:hypothetical protein
MARRVSCFAALLSLLVAAGCASEGATSSKAMAPKPATHGVAAPTPRAPPLLEVPAGTYGPYVGQRGDDLILTWAVPSDQGSSWWTLALDATGHARGKPKQVASGDSSVDLVAVRSSAPASSGG